MKTQTINEQIRHIVPISGKDSLCTALWLNAKYPDVDYEYIHNDVFADPPEVKDWLNKVEKRLGKPIIRVGENLPELIQRMGFLPSRLMRYCTRIGKIEAMEKYIGDDNAIIYYGLRADEPARVGYTAGENTTPSYPLRDDGLGIQHVYTIVNHAGLTPPRFFWKSLFYLVVKELGENAYLLHELPTETFYSLFAWRTRPNCMFCFNMRLYEVVGLIEHHPKWFHEVYVKLENEVGGDGYFWHKDYPAKRFLDPVEQKRIKMNRVKQVVNFVLKKQQPYLFPEYDDDVLSITSCGLVCGK